MPDGPTDDRRRALLAAAGLLAFALGAPPAQADARIQQKISPEYTRHKKGSGLEEARLHRTRHRRQEITVNKAKIREASPGGSRPE